MERVAMQAVARPELGKRGARRLRRQGMIPAEIYGKGLVNHQVAVNEREFIKLLHGTGEKIIIDLTVAGTETPAHTVIIKHIDYNTLRVGMVHVDFQQVVLTEAVRVSVPLLFRGEEQCPGLKAGGILEHALREVEIESLPLQLPKHIVVDVSALDIGQTLCVRDVSAPEGVSILADPEQLIAVIAWAREEKPAEEAAPAESAEPEVIKQKKPEAETAKK